MRVRVCSGFGGEIKRGGSCGCDGWRWRRPCEEDHVFLRDCTEMRRETSISLLGEEKALVMGFT
jgi:hypothetical protein